MVDDQSPAGSYRAAINPNGFCAACGQIICAHPDVIYQGLLNPVEGCADTDARASTPVVPHSFHGSELPGV